MQLIPQSSNRSPFTRSEGKIHYLVQAKCCRLLGLGTQATVKKRSALVLRSGGIRRAISDLPLIRITRNTLPPVDLPQQAERSGPELVSHKFKGKKTGQCLYSDDSEEEFDEVVEDETEDEGEVDKEDGDGDFSDDESEGEDEEEGEEEYDGID